MKRRREERKMKQKKTKGKEDDRVFCLFPSSFPFIFFSLLSSRLCALA